MKSTTQAGLQPAGEKVPAHPYLQHELATFAAGCFWGVEDAFRKLAGVTSTTVGYTGGHHENPTYEDVCSGLTGHAEAVEVVYDPSQVGYEKLLDLFWNLHDPTQYNRQGADIGSQYRSAIFYHSIEQEQEARLSKARHEKSGRYRGAIVTQIGPASLFYKAEDYHQQYFEKLAQEVCHTAL